MNDTKSSPAKGREWGRWGPVFVVLAVLCLLVGGYLLDLAAPQTANLFDKRWDAPVRTSWDQVTARAGALLVAASAASCAIGLLVRAFCGRGPSDRAAQALGVLGLVAAFASFLIWRNVPMS